MATYPSKPWSDGQEHEIVPGQTYRYNASQGTWDFVSQAVHDDDYQVDKAALQASINTNSANISSLTTRVTTAEGTISTHTSDIAALSADVSTAQSNISINTADIAELKNAASLDSDRVTEIATTVVNNSAAVTTNTSNISALDTRLTTAEGSIVTNTSDIATNASQIASVNSTLSASISTLNSKVNTDSDRLEALSSRINIVELLADSEVDRVQSNIDRINTAYAMLDSDSLNLQALRTDLETQISVASASVLSFNTDDNPTWTTSSEALSAKTGAIATLFGNTYRFQDLIPLPMAQEDTSQSGWSVTASSTANSAVSTLFDDSTAGFFANYDSDNPDVYFAVTRTLSDHDWVLSYFEMTLPGTSGSIVNRSWVDFQLIGIDTNNVETLIQTYTTPANSVAGQKVKFTVNSSNFKNNGVGWKGFKFKLLRNAGHASTSTIQDFNLHGYRLSSEAANPFVTFTIKGADGNWSELKLAADNIVADSDWINTQITAAKASVDSDVAVANARLTTVESTASTNASNISTAQSDIASIQTDVTTAQSDITSIQTQLNALSARTDAELDSDIAVLQAQIDSLSASVSTNTSSISTNATGITQLQSAVSTNATNIASHGSDIAALQSDVSSLAMPVISATAPTGAAGLLWVNLNDSKLYFWNATSEAWTEIANGI